MNNLHFVPMMKCESNDKNILTKTQSNNEHYWLTFNSKEH